MIFLKVTAIHLVVIVLALSACARRDEIPAVRSEGASTSTFVQTGSFFEYALPSFTNNVTYLANGPSNTVWFVCSTKPAAASFGTWYVCAMSSSGTVTAVGLRPPPYQPPPPYYVTGRKFWVDPIISSAGGYFWYEVVAAYSTAYCGSLCRSGPTFYQSYLVRRSPAGSSTLFATNQGFRNALLASDGNVWIPAGNSLDSISPAATTGPTQKAQLPANWEALWVACRYEPCSTLDPHLYVLAIYAGSASSNAAVFKISTSGQIVQTYNLPVGSNPRVITDGSDGNLWITEDYAATGPSKIARLQPSTGAITQFSVSASNAGLGAITKGADGALWFTESAVSRIGRITTSGLINQYTVPTASSQPNGIVACPTTVCGIHGGVWFAETAANKIARYDFPSTTACTSQGNECAPLFPPCCPGLVCVPASTRAFCEPASALTQYPHVAANANSVSVIDTVRKIVTRTIPVGAGAVSLAITPDGRKVYVANTLARSISVIDTNKNIVVRSIALGFLSRPIDVAVAWNGLAAYVSDSQGNAVAVIDTATDAVATTLPVGILPTNIMTLKRCSSGVVGSVDGSIAYLLNGSDKTSSSTSSVIDNIAFLYGQTDPADPARDQVLR